MFQFFKGLVPPMPSFLFIFKFFLYTVQYLNRVWLDWMFFTRLTRCIQHFYHLQPRNINWEVAVGHSVETYSLSWLGQEAPGGPCHPLL